MHRLADHRDVPGNKENRITILRSEVRRILVESGTDYHFTLQTLHLPPRLREISTSQQICLVEEHRSAGPIYVSN